MSDFEVKRTGETITVGRKDYGWGITAELVTVDGDVFAVTRSGKFLSQCGQCDGGWSGSKGHFAHVLSAVCFDCNGTGVHKRYDDEAKVVALVKRRRADAARRARKAAEKEAAQRAEHAAWVAEHPALAAELAEILAELPDDDRSDEAYYAQRDAYDKWGDFVLLMAQRAAWGALSDAQAESVTEAIAQVRARHQAKAEKLAASRHAGEVDEKVTVTGTVTVATTVDTRYGTARLVVVTGTGDDAGVTVKAFGSGKTLWEAAKGQDVTVTGTVSKHGEYDGLPQTELARAKVTAR